MLYNINLIPLHCVFHGIRFKVNEGWLSGIDSLLFLLFSHFFLSKKIPTFAVYITKKTIFDFILVS